MSRINFYKKNLKKYLNDKDSKILVLGAGELDIKIFHELKYTNVTFSNYNLNENQTNYINLCLHNINLKSNSYDYCVAHASIHHSSKPHNSILEMYRVASRGILVIEAKDTFLVRLACKINYAEEFEKSAVSKNKTFGGVDNSTIPNFVYRWTEREVYKLLSSYDPEKKHQIYFDNSYDIKFTNNILLKILFYFFFVFFKSQQNLFSFFILKK